MGVKTQVGGKPRQGKGRMSKTKDVDRREPAKGEVPENVVQPPDNIAKKREKLRNGNELGGGERAAHSEK